MVTLKKIWSGVAPSILAASKRLSSMPIIPAIKRIVVLPYHIRKFIVATRVRVQPVYVRKRILSFVQPSEMKIALTGPLSENSVKKSIAKADAIIRFGM